MSSLHWDPNTSIVLFVLENMDPANDSSIGERLKSRRATRSDHIDHLNKGEDAAGKQTIKQLMELPSERRSLKFLSSHLALERSAIWGKSLFHSLSFSLVTILKMTHCFLDYNMSESQRASAPGPFELFLDAYGKLAEMGSSAPASECLVRITEVPRGGILAAGKRIVEHSLGDRMESRRKKVSPFSAGETGTSHSYSWTEFLDVRLLVMFSFRSVEEKLAETVEESSKDHEAFVLMRERFETEKKKCMDQFYTIDDKDKEIGGPP
ncbi:unnamed protein product [Cochlearia groenlandica]